MVVAAAVMAMMMMMAKVPRHLLISETRSPITFIFGMRHL